MKQLSNLYDFLLLHTTTRSNQVGRVPLIEKTQKETCLDSRVDRIGFPVSNFLNIRELKLQNEMGHCHAAKSLLFFVFWLFVFQYLAHTHKLQSIAISYDYFSRLIIL